MSVLWGSVMWVCTDVLTHEHCMYVRAMTRPDIPRSSVVFDMDVLSKKLKEQKEQKEKKEQDKKGTKSTRPKQEYSPVVLDSGMNDEEEMFENDPVPPLAPSTTKDKPLPLPPTKKKPTCSIKVEAHSPKSYSPKRVAPPPPSPKLKPTTKQGASAATGKRKNSEGTHPLASTITPAHHSHMDHKDLSPPHRRSLSLDNEPGSEELEPMYENTIPASHSQPLEPLDEANYQNCDFDGSPLPSSEVVATCTPTAETCSLVPPGDQDHYQNFAFQTQKAAKQKQNATMKAAKSSSRPSISSQKYHHHKSASHDNGSAKEEPANMYQNVGFKKS